MIRTYFDIILILKLIAKNTKPTGFVFVPPEGPAIPVIDIHNLLFDNFFRFFTICLAVSYETAPFLFKLLGGILSKLDLDLF